MEIFTNNSNKKEEEGFLATEPPPWAACAVARLIIGLSVLTFLAALVIQLPETVTCRFALEPVTASDPLRAPYTGTITQIMKREGETVKKGDLLFVLSSDEASDRGSEFKTLETSVAGFKEKLLNLREQHKLGIEKYETDVKIQSQEIENFKAEIAFRKKEREHALVILEKGRSLFTSQVISAVQLNRLELDAAKATRELQETQKSFDVAELKLKEMASIHERDEHQFSEDERGLLEEIDKAHIRLQSLQSLTSQRAQDDLQITSPIDATILHLGVNTAGAFVHTGDILADITPLGAELFAKLHVPQEGLGKLRVEQKTKLLFDGFPYQRYGTKSGSVTWISPAQIVDGQNLEFQAHVKLSDTMMRVAGESIALSAGMSGTARVLIGKRSIINFAFEPLRQLRENLSADS